MYSSGVPREVKEDETWVGVRLPKVAHQQLKEWAKEEDMSLSQLMRRLLLQELRQREKQGE